MIPENEVVDHSHYIRRIVWVFLFNVTQDFDLIDSLSVVHLVLFHNLEGELLVFLVVEYPEDFPEGSLPKLFDDFIPVVDLVSLRSSIIPSKIRKYLLIIEILATFCLQRL